MHVESAPLAALSTRPKVTVIVPLYDGRRFIAQALDSALAQTFRDFEIVIVDDGSTDDSRECIARHLELPQVRFVRQRNLGVAAARNTGIRSSSGEIVAFLDQDDVWLPDKLALQVEYLDRPPMPNSYMGSRSIWVPRASGRIWQGLGRGSDGPVFPGIVARNRIAVLTVAVRRTCLAQVGPFDETISKADDYELWLRIAKQFPLGFIPQVLGRYRTHEANASKDAFAMDVAELGALDAILGHFPMPDASSGTRWFARAFTI